MRRHDDQRGAVGIHGFVDAVARLDARYASASPTVVGVPSARTRGATPINVCGSAARTGKTLAPVLRATLVAEVSACSANSEPSSGTRIFVSITSPSFPSASWTIVGAAAPGEPRVDELQQPRVFLRVHRH